MNELNKINELERIYKELQPVKPENKQLLDKKFRLEFNYNSNHLEGNTLTYGETEQLIIFDIAPMGDHSFREAEEMKGSDVAYKLIIDWANEAERPISEQQIKNLNQVLLVRPFWKEAITPDGQPTRRMIKVGDYKEFPNSVQLQNGEIFNYASPIDTPILMADLIKWFREEEEKRELHPAVLAALFHYKFVCIHPFDDGNGRISRLLMNYVLIRNGFPPVVIKSADKANYLRALNRADSGDLESFTRYILDQLDWSLQLCIKAANGESLDELGDLDKKISLLMRRLNPDDKKVTLKASNDVIIEFVINKIQKPLMELENLLSRFDPIFENTYSSFFLFYQATGFPEGFNNNQGFKSLSSLIEDLNSGSIKYNIRSLLYEYSIRQTGKKKPDALCRIEFIFHVNKIEIKSESAKIKLEKFYDEEFKNEEVEVIVEKLGNAFLNDIEGLLPKN